MNETQTYELRLATAPRNSAQLYNSKPSPAKRSYIEAIPYGVIALPIYPLIVWVVKQTMGEINGLNSWMAGLVGIAAAISLGVLLSDARNRNSMALQAITVLVAANQTVAGFIEALEDQEMRARCRWAYTHVIRAIFCLADGQAFEVIHPDKEATRNSSFSSVRQWLHMELMAAGLDKVLIGGNGRMNAVQQARSTVNTLTTIRIPRGTYLAVGILFGITYVSAAVFMASSGAELYLGMALEGTFIYGIAMMMITARNRGYPYGTGKEMIEMNARFIKIETENRRAQQTAEIYRFCKNDKEQVA